MRRELFISYSHHDQDLMDRLRVHLKSLENRCLVVPWEDSRLNAGDLWREEIGQALTRAQLALLLVSPDFLVSDFIQGVELPALFQSAEQQGLKILWVLLRPAYWEIYPEIAKYQRVIPRKAALSRMSFDEQDEAMVEITKEIQAAFQRIESERVVSLQAAEDWEAACKTQHAADHPLPVEIKLKAKDGELNEMARLRAILDQLRREKENLNQQGDQARLQKAQISERLPPLQQLDPPLIQFPSTRGWLEREGNQWPIKTEPITFAGYEEQLASGIALKMVQIPAGTFLMGSPKTEADRNDDEGPQHWVQLKSFFLGQTPVTQAQWQVVADWPKQELELNPNPSRFKGANRPVEQVSWEEAMEFCRRLSQYSQRNYSLPSEAQWEYACRSGTITPFAFGEALTPDLANYDANRAYGSGPKGAYRQETTNVDSFPANAWGLQDMHGNVWDWCLDEWHGNYLAAPVDGSPWLDVVQSDSEGRLLRGGSWFNEPHFCRSAYRLSRHPASRFVSVGFRVCCLPSRPAS